MPDDPLHEPDGYVPPQSTAELVSRYGAGERYFRRTILAHPSFVGEALEFVNLGDAHLDGADFSDCQLTGAYFMNAQLREAKFEGGNVDGSNFFNATLRGADLTSSNFLGANFERADLGQACVDDCVLDLAELLGADLSDLRGAPCSSAGVILDAAAFARSGWRWADLRRWVTAGARLVDQAQLPPAIQEGLSPTSGAPATEATSSAAVSVFLSHSSSDKIFVRRLASRLRVVGVRVWLDEAQMTIGDPLTDKISEAVGAVDYVVAVISRAALGSTWVQNELRAALEREAQERRVLVLPIRLEPVEMPSSLAHKLYADFISPAPGEFEISLHGLLDAMGVDASQAPL